MAWIEKYVNYVGGESNAVLITVLACLSLLLLGVLLRVLYGLILAVVAIRRFVRNRRRLRLAIRRQVQYTLPQRENTFVRDRLQTALNVEVAEEEEEKGLSLEYARKMLAQLQSSTLSPVERLEVEELAHLLALYACKEKWSASDRKTLSEGFSRILKLSAKYEIAG